MKTSFRCHVFDIMSKIRRSFEAACEVAKIVAPTEQAVDVLEKIDEDDMDEDEDDANEGEEEDEDEDEDFENFGKILRIVDI